MTARILAIADGLPPGTRWLLIDASAIAQIDSTAAATLIDLHADLAGRGIALGLAELHGEARAMLDRAGATELIGPGMVFDDLEDADRYFKLAT